MLHTILFIHTYVARIYNKTYSSVFLLGFFLYVVSCIEIRNVHKLNCVRNDLMIKNNKQIKFIIWKRRKKSMNFIYWLLFFMFTSRMCNTFYIDIFLHIKYLYQYKYVLATYNLIITSHSFKANGKKSTCTTIYF